MAYNQASHWHRSMIECRHFAGSEDIYNPFSQLNSQSDKMFGSYWFETATPTFLIERIDGAMERMKSFIAGIPYGLENKSEKHFQTIIYLIFSLLGYYIQAEVKSAIARADAVCWTKDRIYVFEFKVDGSADEALRRID